MRASEALAALTATKPAFAETEAEQLTQLADACMRRGSVAWLEVGAGDGRNLAFQLGVLGVGRAIRAVAVEPAHMHPAPIEGVEWVSCRIEDYRPDRPFDWIGIRHSAYYITDPVGEIARLTRSLTAGGTLALTHWGGDCILRRLHVAMCGDTGEAAVLGVEDLSQELAAVSDLDVSPTIETCTVLDVSKVLADPTIAAALAKLACRGRQRLRPGSDPATEATDIIDQLPNSGARRNGIVLVRRRP